MIGWLWRVIVGRFSSCDHTWKTEARYEISSVITNKQIGERWVQRCSKCGALHVLQI